ncbi:DUF6314 family protein [Promicromonospora thailandica]|uniref:DUF6314 domain-containing protein n=1 Tax=Promicromonospora thailandica TaxID=765201 RepID=A0A9X2JWL6_9MICO|nr:DUF6314 family protein [Promicromonospora thailandica]MCP2266730.1 hypothetical protein [Promicromonospora thailandica]BFF21888.1 hypothetical protein GCM10025730_54090 [Promicromonospora thailandica]
MSPLRLLGTWDFRREVTHADGSRYTATGQAHLRRLDDGRVRWDEHGTLRWEAGSTPVSRTLYLVPAPASAPPAPEPDWRVTFEDGRDFHPWTPGAVEHLCGRDLYRGDLDVPAGPAASAGPASAVVVRPASAVVVRPPSWELDWHVTGPEKDYEMRTRYTVPPDTALPFETEVASLSAL